MPVLLWGVTLQRRCGWLSRGFQTHQPFQKSPIAPVARTGSSLSADTFGDRSGQAVLTGEEMIIVGEDSATESETEEESTGDEMEFGRYELDPNEHGQCLVWHPLQPGHTQGIWRCRDFDGNTCHKT
jgi:hypothetical protein